MKAAVFSLIEPPGKQIAWCRLKALLVADSQPSSNPNGGAMRTRLMILLTGTLCLVSVPVVRGEPFLDLYGGWSKARGTAVSASQRTCFLVGCTTTITTTQSLTFRSGVAAGARGGYWFERAAWFSVAGDFSYFRTASAPVRLDTLSFAATPMLRLPLWSTPDRPQGHLQPYVGVGPTLVSHLLSADFQPDWPIELGGWSIGVGWTARGGLAVPISEHIALFGEWRFTQDRVRFRQHGFLNIGHDGRLDVTQTTQQSLFGLSYRF